MNAINPSPISMLGAYDGRSEREFDWFAAHRSKHFDGMAAALAACNSDAVWFDRGPDDHQLHVLLVNVSSASAVGRVAEYEHIVRAMRRVRVEEFEAPPSRFATRVWSSVMCATTGIDLPADLFELDHCLARTAGKRGLLVRIGEFAPIGFSFPFDHWLRFPPKDAPGLREYDRVDWIVSERSWGEPAADRSRLQQCFRRDSAAFFADCHFIINTEYSHWDHAASAEVSAGAHILRAVRDCLPEPLRHRMHFNPDKNSVDSILRTSECRYVFGNFHTERGAWLTCAGEPISIEPFISNKELSHLDMVSASHCNSVADSCMHMPDNICKQLIKAGVRATSGSTEWEDARDFICRMLCLMLDAEAFGPMVYLYLLLAGKDPNAVLLEANAYLIGRGYPGLRHPVVN